MRGVYCMSSTGNPKYGGGWNNQQLRKDCGLVPWLLAKNHGFRAVMVGMKCSTEYPYLADMPERDKIALRWRTRKNLRASQLRYGGGSR